MEFIANGVTAPKGFKANGIHCGMRKNHDKKDLALIYSESKATAAAIYTKNKVKGSHIEVMKKHLSDNSAQAVIVNSGNANTCNADGVEKAERMCEIAANQLGLDPVDVLCASTGVIGMPLDVTPIENGIGELVDGLSYTGSADAAQAIMTTDTIEKEYAVEFRLGGVKCTIGGIAKGSGMIHPNLGTMLVFLTTDVAISGEMLHRALLKDAQDSFNMVSIDGDTSTNDTVCCLANGMSGNEEITAYGDDYITFTLALGVLTDKLCDDIARDGEGATKFVKCIVQGAKDDDTAKCIAKSVVCSSLVKAAMFGADANWGRVLCAIGYAPCEVDTDKADVVFASKKGGIIVCENGSGVEFDEEKAKEILLEDEVEIQITLGDGKGYAVAKGCDLTYDYVKINGDYRT